MRKYSSIDNTELRKTCPKSLAKLKEWLYAPDKTNGEDISGISDDQREQLINFTLGLNPRMLFDFFDDQNIYVTIQPDDTTGEVSGFMYYNSKSPYSSSSNNRNTAEELAFIQAFEELEKQL